MITDINSEDRLVEKTFADHLCDAPHPGGMADNSPTFKRWVRGFRGA